MQKWTTMGKRFRWNRVLKLELDLEPEIRTLQEEGGQQCISVQCVLFWCSHLSQFVAMGAEQQAMQKLSAFQERSARSAGSHTGARARRAISR